MFAATALCILVDAPFSTIQKILVPGKDLNRKKWASFCLLHILSSPKRNLSVHFPTDVWIYCRHNKEELYNEINNFTDTWLTTEPAPQREEVQEAEIQVERENENFVI